MPPQPRIFFLKLKSPIPAGARSFGSGGGSRGARGHGWWINYREGKGGRHLQGEYSHLNIEELKAWNDAVFSLGSQFVYMDVLVEPLHQDDDRKDREQHRLVIELANETFPRATENFVKLLEARKDGFLSSTLHRVEKKVGLLGGNVWNNTGKCHESLRMPTSLTSMQQSEKMVLSHLPGVVTMLSQRVGEIDSRFLLCCTHAPHLDGKAVAIGRMDDASLEQVRKWESSLITQKGHPTTVQLRIAECGILEEGRTAETA
jgi:cyclophilin family peptidyl-prolyl cis-trans isomerase